MTTTNTTTDTAERVIALLRDLVHSYTRNHNELRVDGATMGKTLVLAIKGNRDDHPKLVGTAGKHIWALQTIFNAIGAKLDIRINLTLLEPDQGNKRPPSEFRPNPDWQPEPMLALIRRILEEALGVPYSLNPCRVVDLTTIQVRPAVWTQLCERGDFAKALHALCHAIGKTEGHDVHIQFCAPDER